LTDHPQLVANSRHISGTYSIRELGWDASASVLHGVSETIPGQPYTLFIYVPETARLTGAEAASETKGKMEVGCLQIEHLLRATLSGAPGLVRWQMAFKRQGTNSR